MKSVRKFEMQMLNLAEYFKKNKLMKEMVWSFFAKGVAFILIFTINIILARFLGVQQFGSWSFFYSILSIFFLLSTFGLNASSKKFVAEYNKTKYLKDVLNTSLKLRFVFSLLFSLLLIIIFKPIVEIIGREDLESLFYLAIPLVFLSGLTEYLKEIFAGLHRIKYNFFINLTEYGLKVILVIISLLISSNLQNLVVSYSIALFITSLIGLLFLYINFYKKLQFAYKNFSKKIFKYSLPLFFTGIGFWIATELDTIMLGIIKNDYEVGIYSVAKNIIIKLPHISLIIAMGTMPIFAKLDDKNRNNLKFLFNKLLKLNGLLFVAITLCIISFSNILIPFIYGENFIYSATPLKLLTPYLIAFSYSIFLSTFLDYQGLANKRAINLSLSIVLNIFLNYLLIPIYGVNGAAIATSISYMPYVILNGLEVKKILK